MATIKIGNLDISSFKVGGNDCSIYLGDIKLYPTTPPSFDGKYKFTLTDDSVVSGECDASSEITSAQTSAYTTTMKEAVIGDCVTSISSNTFYGYTSLTSCTIGSGVTSIGGSAFRYCSNLTNCTIGDNVTIISDYAFQNCTSLTSINIPSGVTTISNNTFNGCTSLTSITIPNSVTSIGVNAFYSCAGLTSCTIGSGVTWVGDRAFRYCSGLTSVTVNAQNPPTLGSNVFSNTPIASGTGYIYVPSASVEAYKAATNWSTYASRIQAIPNS